MRNKALTFSLTGCLTAAWLSAASAQPNLADLLDQEGAAQPRPVAALAAPSLTPAGPVKEPIPAAAETKQALAAVQDIFRVEFVAANTPDKRVALAQQLLAQAERTSKSSDRWALFVEAARLAAEAGDPATTFAVIDATTAVYAVDPLTAKLDAIGRLVPKVSPQGADDLSLACLEMCRTLIGRGDLAEARKLLTMTSALTKKTRNRALTAEVNKLTVAIRDAEKVGKERDAILEKLAANPGDPELCLEAGSYFCFKAGDWEKGLPLLAKGSDAELARLAKDDLAAAGSAARAAALGDAWWTWAEKHRGPLKAAGMIRASLAYETAVAAAQGLEKVRLEKRIKEAQADQPVTGRRVALADLGELSAKNIWGGFSKEGKFQGKPFLCRGQEWPKALCVCPDTAAGGIATVTVQVPRGAKRLIGVAGIFTASADTPPNVQPVTPQNFEIMVDRRSAWKSPPLKKRDDTAAFDVDITGAMAIELRVMTEHGAAAWAAWLNPEILF